MSGFVAAYREALDHPLFFGNAERLGAWMWLVMRAAWKPTPYDIGGKIITIERGQLCTSRAQLAKSWGMSPSGVERFLTRLKTEQMIEQATGHGKSVITICNYNKYQDVSDDAGQPTGQATGQQSDSHRTTKEQGNKGTRDIEPNGPISQRADAPIPEKPEKRSSTWVAIDRPESVSVDVWTEFELHRKRKGAAITDTVMRAFEREAGKLGWSLEAAIIKSIERNWQGFEASWIRKENGNGNYHNQPDEPHGLEKAIAARRIAEASQQSELL